MGYYDPRAMIFYDLESYGVDPSKISVHPYGAYSFTLYNRTECLNFSVQPHIEGEREIVQ